MAPKDMTQFIQKIATHGVLDHIGMLLLWNLSEPLYNQIKLQVQGVQIYSPTMVTVSLSLLSRYLRPSDDLRFWAQGIHLYDLSQMFVLYNIFRNRMCLHR